MNSLSYRNNSVARPLTLMPHRSVQAKLTINTPGDHYEQEADAMANRVMSMGTGQNHLKAVTGLIGNSVQRKCAACEEDEKKKTVMRKAEGGGGIQASSSLQSSLANSKRGGASLPGGTRNFMENAFSSDFSNVRIHTGGKASEMNNGINARAFTYGSDIYFNNGQFSPQSNEGRKLLAHELTHVVQQGNGKNLGNPQLVQRSLGEVKDLLEQPFPDAVHDPTGDKMVAIRRKLNAEARFLTSSEAEQISFWLVTNSKDSITIRFQMLHHDIRAELLSKFFGKLSHLTAEALLDRIKGDSVKQFNRLVPSEATKKSLLAVLAGRFASHQLPAGKKLWVTLEDANFSNSGSLNSDNKCTSCSDGVFANLGLQQPDARNSMELRGDIAGSTTGVQFNFKRTVEKGSWRKMNNAWELSKDQDAYLPPGTDDDANDSDEQLIPVNNHIFVVDAPGIREMRIPASPDPYNKATEFKYVASFEEWVEAKIGSGPWERVSDIFEWHSISTIEKGSPLWHRAGTNEIGPGNTIVEP